MIVDGADLYGDGVNIAARLQALAEPGGILISGSVYEHVRNKLALGFAFLGARPVKNIADAVPVYQVLLHPGAAPSPAPSGASQGVAPRDDRRRRVRYMAAQAALLVALFFAIDLFSSSTTTWFQWPSLAIVFVFGLRVLSLYR